MDKFEELAAESYLASIRDAAARLAAEALELPPIVEVSKSWAMSGTEASFVALKTYAYTLGINVKEEETKLE